MSNGPTVKRLATLAELDAAGPLWADLQDACSHQHVLMDHRWMSAWWRHFGSGKGQHILVVSTGRTPIGIVPLAVTRGFEAFPLREPYVMGPDDYRFLPRLRWQRIVPLRRLTFPLNLIAGNIRGQAIFPNPDHGSYAALTRYAADIGAEWDVATFAGLRAWEKEDAMLRSAALSAGLSSGARQASRPMLYIDIPASLNEFLRSRSSHFRKRMQQECNKLERSFAAIGPMKVTCYRGKTIVDGLRRLFALELKSWKVGDGKERRLHLALDDQARAFFKDVAERFATDDGAQVLILSFGETDAAGMFTLERGGVASCVLTYRNEHLGEPVSIAPIWRELVERCINHGLRRLDINGYTRNYLKWAKQQHDYAGVLLFNRRLYSRLLQGIDDGAMALGRRLTARNQPASPQPAESSS